MGVMLVERLTVPLNPFRLLSVIVEVIVDPRAMVRLVGLAVMAKFAVLKTAVWTFSGTGVMVPFASVTHVLVVPTLVGVGQPVWNPRGMPELGAVTL
jgi:hypothetical protein